MRHEINRERRREGKNPANMIWLWGAGKSPILQTYKERFNIEGSVITAVDLVKGIGKYLGLDIINVPGVTGYLDTNYIGKAEAALKSLNKKILFWFMLKQQMKQGIMVIYKEK